MRAGAPQRWASLEGARRAEPRRGAISRAARVFGLVLALSAACGGAQRPLTGPALDRADVEADLATTAGALEAAYGPHALRTPETWASMRAELAALADERMDRRRFCERLGGVLTRLTDPGIVVAESVGAERCLDPDGGTAGGYPRPGASLGTNTARTASGPFEARTESGLLVLAVRRFAPAEDPGWATLASVSFDAPAVLVDLRGASGSDPRGFFPALAALLGHPVPPVLRAIRRAEGETADRLRAAALAAGLHARRDREVWATFVGTETPPAIAAAARPPRPMTVLVDRGCEEACQLVARALVTWAGAEVVGSLSTETPLVTDEPALLVLPRSGVTIRFDTTAFVPVEAIERLEGLALLWQTGQGDWDDVFETQLAMLAETVHLRAELARFAASPPPPCASAPAVATPEALPPAARARLHGTLRADEPQIVSAVLALEPEAAQAWVDGCPGLVAHTAFRAGRDGPALVILERTTSFEALSRLLASDVVLRVSIELDAPVTID